MLAWMKEDQGLIDDDTKMMMMMKTRIGGCKGIACSTGGPFKGRDMIVVARVVHLSGVDI
jgi:hypothetical protein